jgi:GT2 family glycosyltransferase
VLSILIVTWRAKQPLQACLQSIANHPPTEPWEAIVVDNDAEDGSAAMVQNQFPWVPGQNLGYAAGNNLAFQHAQGEWLLTLNPDTEFTDHALQLAVDALRSRPEVGALGAKLIGTDGHTQRSVRGFPTLLGILGNLTGMDRVFPRSALGSYRLPAFEYEREGPAPQPMGTFLLFRRQALAAVGDPRSPFDESFPIFFNEVDLLRRMAEAGWPCWFCPQVQVRHLHGASTRQVRPQMVWESHRSLARYLRKHAQGWERPFLPLIDLALWLGAYARTGKRLRGFQAPGGPS